MSGKSIRKGMTDHGMLEMILDMKHWCKCRESYKLNGKVIAKWKVKGLITDEWLRGSEKLMFKL